MPVAVVFGVLLGIVATIPWVPALAQSTSPSAEPELATSIVGDWRGQLYTTWPTVGPRRGNFRVENLHLRFTAYGLMIGDREGVPAYRADYLVIGQAVFSTGYEQGAPIVLQDIRVHGDRLEFIVLQDANGQAFFPHEGSAAVLTRQ